MPEEKVEAVQKAGGEAAETKSQVVGEKATETKPQEPKEKATEIESQAVEAKVVIKKPEAAASKSSSSAEARGQKSTAIDDIMAAIKSMSVLELSQLVKTLETEFGISAAAPMVAALAPGTSATETAPA